MSQFNSRKRLRLENENILDIVENIDIKDIFELRSFDNSVEEVCIGQSLAYVAGDIAMGKSYRRNFKNTLMELFRGDCAIEHKKIVQIHVGNIQFHSTDMFLYRFNDRILAWYINPWGHEHDDSYTKRLSLFRKKYFDNTKDYKDFFPTATENALRGLDPSYSELESIWTTDNDKIQKIKERVRSIEGINSTIKESMTHDLSEYLFYAKVKSMASHSLIQQMNIHKNDEDLYGVFHTFRLLKHFYRRSDINLIPQTLSMNPTGPQGRSDLSKESDILCKHVNDNGEGLGDCAVWTKSYVIVAEHHLNLAKSESDVINIITHALKNLYIMKEKSSRHYVGKIMMSTELGKILKPMKILYKTIPVEHIQDINGKSAFKKHIRIKYDEIVKLINTLEFHETLVVRQKQVYFIFVSFLDMIDRTEDGKKMGCFNRIMVRNVSSDTNIQMMVSGFIRYFPHMSINKVCKLLLDVVLIIISCIFSSEIFNDSSLNI